MILHINWERFGDWWRRLSHYPPGLTQTKSQLEAARTAPPKTAVAIVSLRMAFCVPSPDHAVRHSRITRWRLHLLAGIASLLSFKSSRQRPRLAFGGTVAACTNHRALLCYSWRALSSATASLLFICATVHLPALAEAELIPTYLCK